MSKIDKDLWQYTEWCECGLSVMKFETLPDCGIFDWFIRNTIISYKHALYARLEGMIAFEFWTHTNLDFIIYSINTLNVKSNHRKRNRIMCIYKKHNLIKLKKGNKAVLFSNTIIN